MSPLPPSSIAVRTDRRLAGIERFCQYDAQRIPRALLGDETRARYLARTPEERREFLRERIAADIEAASRLVDAKKAGAAA
jgi:hypothetical protein